jgi:hypothetical protein
MAKTAHKLAAGTATGETSTKLACAFPNALFKAVQKIAASQGDTVSNTIRTFVREGLTKRGALPKSEGAFAARKPAAQSAAKPAERLSHKQNPAQKRIAREKRAAAAKKTARKSTRGAK